MRLFVKLAVLAMLAVAVAADDVGRRYHHRHLRDIHNAHLAPAATEPLVASAAGESSSIALEAQANLQAEVLSRAQAKVGAIHVTAQAWLSTAAERMFKTPACWGTLSAALGGGAQVPPTINTQGFPALAGGGAGPCNNAANGGTCHPGTHLFRGFLDDPLCGPGAAAPITRAATSDMFQAGCACIVNAFCPAAGSPVDLVANPALGAAPAPAPLNAGNPNCANMRADLAGAGGTFNIAGPLDLGQAAAAGIPGCAALATLAPVAPATANEVSSCWLAVAMAYIVDGLLSDELAGGAGPQLAVRAHTTKTLDSRVTAAYLRALAIRTEAVSNAAAGVLLGPAFAAAYQGAQVRMPISLIAAHHSLHGDLENIGAAPLRSWKGEANTGLHSLERLNEVWTNDNWPLATPSRRTKRRECFTYQNGVVACKIWMTVFPPPAAGACPIVAEAFYKTLFGQPQLGNFGADRSMDALVDLAQALIDEQTRMLAAGGNYADGTALCAPILDGVGNTVFVNGYMNLPLAAGPALPPIYFMRASFFPVTTFTFNGAKDAATEYARHPPAPGNTAMDQAPISFMAVDRMPDCPLPSQMAPQGMVNT